VAQFRPHPLGFDLTEAGVYGNARNPMFERHFARKLVQLLEDFDENHLAKILLSSSSRPMGPHHFRDKRIESAHQLASRFIVMPKRGLNQRIRFRIIHVQIASTLQTMTGEDALWLQVSQRKDDKN
jgi:hypothetical protein